MSLQEKKERIVAKFRQLHGRVPFDFGDWQIEEISEFFNDHEVIEAMLEAEVLKRGELLTNRSSLDLGMLIATNERLVFINRFFGYKDEINEISYSSIHSIECKSEWLEAKGKIMIYEQSRHSTETTILSISDKKKGKNFVNLVSDLVRQKGISKKVVDYRPAASTILPITRVSVYVEPLATFFLGEGMFMSTVDVNPPETLIESADKTLNLSGELIAYVRRNPIRDIEKINSLTTDVEQQSFFERKARSSKWLTYYTSTPTKLRYSVLVEFYDRA